MMKVYLTKTDVVSADGNQAIKSGKLVMANKEKITTLDGKIEIAIPKGSLKNYTRACKFTCTADEILIMEFRTDFHTYMAIGQNPLLMYKKIIKLYNGYSGQNYNANNFHNGLYEDNLNTKISDNYSVVVTKVKTDCVYWDDGSDYYDMSDKYPPYSKSTVCCGDWFDLYNSNNPKCFPNKSMK